MGNQKSSIFLALVVTFIVLALIFVAAPQFADWLDRDELMPQLCFGVIILIGIAFVAKR